ncbi:uncharacterized protein Z518_04300 [Rhinocladiella mackenziei CBS 650.93]|uniref:Velvet domain-containing protein n=1 Tax=Rhinocladiella mackenziei CBS 650.93 TaxID=1442369 RepID=A0A0D2JB38_9EURO|nr:uncharacterized protein Z518_04300 [Rhinocladiella mackenziei CBS 650.93]KIX06325.1 hypothetical protein Z518_04300 [Rhinocladiella mackenziei CBS 650.93]
MASQFLRPQTKGAAKWPLDPPPVIEFVLHDNDTSRSYLHSPNWFCSVGIEPLSWEPPNHDAIAGSLTSSLHRVKLQDNKEYGFFVFGNLYATYPGIFRLRFTAFELRTSPDFVYAAKLTSVYSLPFEVRISKVPTPLRGSTLLSRKLSEAGVKLRLRKEPRRRRSQQTDWSADQRSQAVIPTSALSPPNGIMPPSLSNGQFTMPPGLNGGEILSHRLSYQRAGPLGMTYHPSINMSPPISPPSASIPTTDITAVDNNMFPAIQWQSVHYQQWSLYLQGPDYQHCSQYQDAGQYQQNGQSQHIGQFQQGGQCQQGSQYQALQRITPATAETNMWPENDRDLRAIGWTNPQEDEEECGENGS